MKLLVTADTHIGRRSSRLPETLAAKLTPAAMWLSIIDFAIRERVDAVLAAGDIVDESNAFYEALAPVEQGLKRLEDAGIPLYVVAGNHDWDVLGRLARTVAGDTLHPIGIDGRWQREVLTTDNGEQLQIFGWSFPQPTVSANPLPEFPSATVVPELPAIGLMHANLQGGGYCPVSPNEFDGTNVPTWILGHIHKPATHADLKCSPVLMYPGSPQGLDPGVGETGIHGPWLISYTLGGAQFEHVPLAPLCYAKFTMDATAVESEGQFQEMLLEQARTAADSLVARHRDLRCVVWRVDVVGRCALRNAVIARQLKQFQDDVTMLAELHVVIDETHVNTLPPIDLDAHANENTPLGTAVQLLFELDGTRAMRSTTKDLIARTERWFADVYNNTTYGILRDKRLDSAPDTAACRDILRRQTARFIGALLNREGGAG